MTLLWVHDRKCHPVYEHYRDEDYPHPVRVRKAVEKWWKITEPHLDEAFRYGLCSDPLARFWEQRLAIHLLDEGKVIVHKPDLDGSGAGPDFLVRESSEGRTWIEAVALTCGGKENKNRVPEIKATGVAQRVPTDKIEGRILRAMNKKVKRINKYFDTGIIENNDRVVIAICTGNIPYRLIDERGTPFCVLYPVHDPQWKFFIGNEDIGPSYQRLAAIRDSSCTAKNAGHFANDQNSRISGVIWSTYSIGNYWFPESFMFYFPNPFATNPLEDRWMNWNREWTVDVSGDTAELNKVQYHE